MFSPCSSCDTHAEGRLPGASHARSLQQQQFDDSPLEQDVSAYLADLAAAAGMSVEDLRFDSTLDDKVGATQTAAAAVVLL